MHSNQQAPAAAGPPRLLICDDEPAFARFVQSVAADLGFVTETVGNGLAFVERFDIFRPTTVVLDMIMPEMDGIEVMAWLAEQRAAVRLIILTGFAPDDAMDLLAAAAAAGLPSAVFVKKPVRLGALRAVLAADLAGEPAPSRPAAPQDGDSADEADEAGGG
jgi:CheY-like chemotaxis protein